MPIDSLIKSLSVKLNETELALRGKELAEAMTKRDGLDDAKKCFLDQWKDDVAEADTRVTELRGVCMSGQEYRPIECKLVKDFSRGVREIVRIDTGAVIESKVMTTEERQVSLPIDAKAKTEPAPAPTLPGKACEGCSMADGNHHPECVVAHGEPEEPVEAAPEQAEIKPDGRLVQHMQLPAAKTRLGKGIDGNEYPITEEEADRCLAGKKVFADIDDDGSVVVELVGVAMRDGKPVVIDGDFEGDDGGLDDEEEGEDEALAEAAEIAAQQLADGDAPEVAADAALAEKVAEDKKRTRGRGKPKGV